MSNPTSDQPARSVVLLAGDTLPPSVLTALEGLGEVVRVGSAAEAARRLAAHPGDIVIAEAAELLPLACEVGHREAEAILAHGAQGACVVQRDGTLAWMNAALRSLPDEVVEAVRQACVGVLADLDAGAVEGADLRTRKRSLCAGGDRYFELTASGLTAVDGRMDRVVGLVCETSAMCRLREKIDAIDAAGRELVALDSDATARLDVPERLRVLEERLIYYCRDLLSFTHIAVLVLDPSDQRLEPLLLGGFPEAVRNLEIYARREGNGISGYVAATGQSYVCPDLSQEPRYLLGLESARSSLTVPLRLHDQVVGVLNVESDRLDAFSEEDRQVAEIFSRYIAAALHILRLLAAERTETTTQVASDVRAEIAGPLNEVLTEATALLEAGQLDDAGAARVRAMIEHVDEAKRSIQYAAEAPAIRGLTAQPPQAQPLLSGKRVLIADDEDIIRETIADVLSKNGALTVMARDGEQAVSMLRAQHFDLVLSDIKMPYRNGYEVFAVAQETQPECHVILITGFGYDPDHSIVRASREGLGGVLFKPFKVEQLFETIQKAVGSAV